MNNRAEPKEPKYHIEESFSIQQLQHKGYSAMLRPHLHPFYELYYLLDGERVYFMNGKVYTAKKGDMVVVVPNELHSTASSDIEKFERVLIEFTHDFVRQTDPPVLELPPFQESALIRFSMKEQPVIEYLLQQMLNECRDQPELYVSCVRQLLTELLIRIHRAGGTSNQALSSEHPMHQKISEIATFINMHFNEPITLEMLAKQFYISPSYLSRIFLKLTGFHCSEYIRYVRIREAQKLLHTTRAKVQAIAEQVGFEHISHFNKTFKAITGLSPLRYRERMKG
ncbi:AraC family transcriptional regulator [Paenibacillus sedimenti]|uniref:Helix-turn-helix transcriptional regulator n=1 Tax=Paenibacillus sedimenti TaxID=2770274 RepID=A0A926QIE3_9BACL|nr:AraC family transcriptional regulator [Paenibacillus sedimenti]MBD0379528.1 helix-turn-helix transcriptional regulator [Paenibacillus sedimenti]